MPVTIPTQSCDSQVSVWISPRSSFARASSAVAASPSWIAALMIAVRWTLWMSFQGDVGPLYRTSEAVIPGTTSMARRTSVRMGSAPRMRLSACLFAAARSIVVMVPRRLRLRSGDPLVYHSVAAQCVDVSPRVPELRQNLGGVLPQSRRVAPDRRRGVRELERTAGHAELGDLRVRDRDEHLARGDLRIVDHLGDIVELRARNAGGVERVDPRGSRPCREDGVEQGVQRVPVRDAHRVREEAGIVGEVRPADDAA